MQEGSFWNNLEEAKQVTQEEKAIESTIKEYSELRSRVEDALDMVELTDEDEEMQTLFLGEVKVASCTATSRRTMS